MKTAVLISGQMRTFARCLPSLHWNVFRKLPSPDFFVSCAKDADAASAELLRKQYPEARVEIEVVEQPALPEPDARLADHAPYAISSPIQGILRQLWHLSMAWKFYAEQTKWGQPNVPPEHELFVRCRPDLHFHRFEMPAFDAPIFGSSDAVFTFYPNDAFIPWWDNYGGINDRFALLGTSSARVYFEAWDVLPKLLEEGCPLHPESIICAAMERGSVRIRRHLAAEFSCRRADGSLVFMKTLPGEIADYIRGETR